MLKFKEQIVSSEFCYPENIRSSYDEYVEIVTAPGSLSMLAFADGQYVGNVMAAPLSEEECTELKVNYDPKTSIYIYNLVVCPQFQGKGLGSVLIKEFIKKCYNQGFNLITGHFRMNGSFHLVNKMGAEIKAVEHNWEDTNEDYVFCELKMPLLVCKA